MERACSVGMAWRAAGMVSEDCRETPVLNPRSVLF